MGSEGLRLVVPGPTPLKRVPLHLQEHFLHHIGINLREARALRWGVESRRRLVEGTGRRCLHLVDNAAVVFVAAKGSSAARALNQEMLSGGVRPVYIWLASAGNRADNPSSWRGMRAGGKVVHRFAPAPKGSVGQATVPEGDHFLPKPRGKLFVHLHEAEWRYLGVVDIDFDRCMGERCELDGQSAWDWLDGVARPLNLCWPS